MVSIYVEKKRLQNICANGGCLGSTHFFTRDTTFLHSLAACIFVLIKFPLILLQEHLQSYKRPQDIRAITLFALYLGNGGCPFCFFSSCDL